MQVEKVLPCVCIDHEPDAGDSVFYGMPELKIAGYHGKPLYTPYCPHCGRGGMYQYKSAYLALKAWNKLIEEITNADRLFCPNCGAKMDLEDNHEQTEKEK